MKAQTVLPLVALFAAAGCGGEATNNVATTELAVTNASSEQQEVAPEYPPDGEVQFFSVLALNQHPQGEQPQLRHGSIAANTDEWAASLYATFTTDRGRRAACTAALVGPRAVLTAAHCVPSSRRIKIQFNNHDFDATCDVHTQYPQHQDDSADFALCRILGDRDATMPGLKYETIDTSPMDQMLQEPRRRLILTGYGCISDHVNQGPSDGLYRIGFNYVDETSNSQARRRGPNYYRPNQDNNMMTRDDPNLANLCPGDSGGPAFRAQPSGEGDYAHRTIIGVNSRVFYRDAARTQYGSSLVSATGGPEFRSWAAQWAGDSHVAVCGLPGGPPNCRR